MALQYVARKHMNVAGRTVAPGEVVPEAAGWRNVQAYIDNGSLAVALEVPGKGPDTASLEDEVAELKAALASVAERVSILVEFNGLTEGTVVSGSDDPDPGTQDGEGPEGSDAPDAGDPAMAPADADGSADGDAESREGEAVDSTPESTPADTVEPIDADALKHISRDELNAKAIALGIVDAPQLGSKGAVAAAINEALAQRESTP